MSNLVSLAEASSYLGVSKATLRNWDKEGKLRAHRHPINRYRAYDLNELRTLRAQSSLLDEDSLPQLRNNRAEVSDVRTVKRLVARLHAILRDVDGDSSLVQRFDELTKILFLRLASDSNADDIFITRPNEDSKKYAQRIRAAYKVQADNFPNVIPTRFAKLTASDSAVFQCGVALASVSFASANFDIKGVAYEEVIKGTFDKSDHQQFFTPHQVVTFMAGMLKPYLRGTVADPACGTAGFLIEASRQSESSIKKLIGLEIDERLAWVSGINLLLHGAPSFEIRCLSEGGSLGEQTNPLRNSLDAILTNPPFGSDLSDANTLETFELGKGRQSRRRGILFIEKCWDLLKEKGVLGIVIDEGVLNLSSSVDVRQFILDRFDILSIVSLPETAFMPYANVNASVLFLRKSASTRRSQNVFFAKAENIGRKPNGDDDIVYDDRGTSKSNSDFPEIQKRWEASLENKGAEADDLSFVANVNKNLTNDDSLRLDFRYHHPSRDKSRELLSKSIHPLWSLSDLCEERNETLIPTTDMADQVILYTGLANIEAKNGVAHQVPTPAASLKSAVKRYEPNDIVFARMRPGLRKVALMTFVEGGFVSPECAVLSIRKDQTGKPLVSPVLLAAALRSDLVYGQIMHLIAGIGRPRLNTTDLRRVRVPLPPTNVQAGSQSEYEGRLASAKQLRHRAHDLLSEADHLELVAVNELATRMIRG